MLPSPAVSVLRQLDTVKTNDATHRGIPLLRACFHHPHPAIHRYVIVSDKLQSLFDGLVDRTLPRV